MHSFVMRKNLSLQLNTDTSVYVFVLSDDQCVYSVYTECQILCSLLGVFVDIFFYFVFGFIFY